MNPKAIGERSEGIILAHLLRKGDVVLLPFGNNQRYDLVVDRAGKLIRGQCKTARYHGGGLSFNACSTSGKSKRSYRGQIDVFWVYAPTLDKIYEVPVDAVATVEGRLRIDEPKLKGRKSNRLAATFEI